MNDAGYIVIWVLLGIAIIGNIGAIVSTRARIRRERYEADLRRRESEV